MGKCRHQGQGPKDMTGPVDPTSNKGDESTPLNRMKAPDLWGCVRCGFVNPDHLRTCEFCDHPKPIADLPGVKVHVTGAKWTLESRVYHALVRRLGGIVCLSKGELEPGPECGLVLQMIEGDGIAMRSDTFSCGAPAEAVGRYQNDSDFHRLCGVLRDLVEKGQFSLGDLFDAVMVVGALGAEAGS
jgi:hypothetical protein